MIVATAIDSVLDEIRRRNRVPVRIYLAAHHMDPFIEDLSKNVTASLQVPLRWRGVPVSLSIVSDPSRVIDDTGAAFTLDACSHRA